MAQVIVNYPLIRDCCARSNPRPLRIGAAPGRRLRPRGPAPRRTAGLRRVCCGPPALPPGGGGQKLELELRRGAGAGVGRAAQDPGLPGLLLGLG